MQIFFFICKIYLSCNYFIFNYCNIFGNPADIPKKTFSVSESVQRICNSNTITNYLFLYVRLIALFFIISEKLLITWVFL